MGLGAGPGLIQPAVIMLPKPRLPPAMHRPLAAGETADQRLRMLNSRRDDPLGVWVVLRGSVGQALLAIWTRPVCRVNAPWVPVLRKPCALVNLALHSWRGSASPLQPMPRVCSGGCCRALSPWARGGGPRQTAPPHATEIETSHTIHRTPSGERLGPLHPSRRPVGRACPQAARCHSAAAGQVCTLAQSA